MRKFTTFALGVCMGMAITGAAFAQGSSSMSASDQTMMKKCQGMSQSAMQQDKDCTAFMQKHPDMMKNGTTGSGSGMSGSNNSMSGSPSSGSMGTTPPSNTTGK